MELIDTKITVDTLKNMSEKMFGKLVKAVVDIEKEIMVVDAEMHSDQEEYLLDHGSKQGDLWGINIYPDETGDNWIEFDSMINIRPSWGNKSRLVENKEIQDKIIKIVTKLVHK